MYRAYFGIDENPFSITPDPRYLYMSEKHQEALAHLLFGVKEGSGFVLLTGEVGTGKTTISRCLLEQLPPNVDAALCINPRMNEVELLANICDELGIAYPRGTSSPKVLVDALNRHLLSAHANGRRSVLVIDEAQNLTPAVLEQIRLLTNLETRKQKLLQIILIGQPELNDLLARHELRQLAQRITARYHLHSLTQRETVGLVRHRLTTGGLDSELFDAAALAEVYRFSGGTPRLINSICDRCLLGAFAQNRRHVDRQLVRTAAAEVLGEEKLERHGRKRILPWATATAAAAAAVLFVALGPIDTSLNWLLARYDAVFTPTESVTAAQPVEDAATPVNEPAEPDLPAAPVARQSAEEVTELPTTPTQPAESIAGDGPEAKPAPDQARAGAAIGANEQSTDEAQDGAPPPPAKEVELGAPPAMAQAVVAESEPTPTQFPIDLTNAPTTLTEEGRVAAASPMTEETEPIERPADAGTPVAEREPLLSPPPTDLTDALSPQTEVGHDAATPLVTQEAEPREPPAEVAAFVAEGELVATPSTADLMKAQLPQTDEGLEEAASPVADEVETSDPPAEAKPILTESMPVATLSPTDFAMVQSLETEAGQDAAASLIAEEAEPAELPAEVAVLVAEGEPVPASSPTDVAKVQPKLTEEGQDTASTAMAEETEPSAPPTTAELVVAESELAPSPSPTDIAKVPPPQTEAGQDAAASPVVDEAEPPELPVTAETLVAESELAPSPSPIDVATAQPPQTEATLAPQTLAAAPVEAAVAPLQSQLPEDEAAALTADPAIDVASIGSEVAVGLPTSEPDQPETLETLFGRPGMKGDLETALLTLFGQWGLDYLGLKGFVPCSKASSAAMKCLQMESDWAGLRSLNRPALITLAFADDERLHAVVSSFDEDSVTLRVGEREIVIEPDTITPHWSGEFLVLWKAPEVYIRHMRTGMTGPDIDWLGSRLAEIDGGTVQTGEAAVFDEAMKQRVVTFQRERGLEVDAVVGPRTMIQLNIAVGAPAEPVLHQSAP